MIKRYDVYVCLGLAVLSLITSLIIADGRYALGPDGCRLINGAINLAEGNGLVNNIVDKNTTEILLEPIVTKPPFYHLLIASLIKLGIEAKTAAWLISQFSFIASTSFLYLIARILLPVLPSLLVGLLFAINVPHLIWSIHAKAVMLMILCIFISLFLLSYYKKKTADTLKPHQLIWIGIFTALAVLSRYLGITLFITISVSLLFSIIFNRKKIMDFIWFQTGVFIAACLPFFIFLTNYLHGNIPQFSPRGQISTWFKISAAIVSSLQSDFLGTAVIWLNNPSFFDIAFIVIVFFIILLLAITEAKRNPVVLNLSLFVIVHLFFLLYIQSEKGLERIDANYILPVQGFLLLFTVSFLWNGFSKSKFRAVYATVSVIAFTTYCYGQYVRFEEFYNYPRGERLSREICKSPKTIDWIKDNIPKASIIMGPQGLYQLIAETNDYHWMPVPPADKYPDTPEFHEKWSEKDFVQIQQKTNASWIVIFNCAKGDPLFNTPGYGSFVAGLFNGIGTNAIKLIKRLEDGYVYKIQPDI